MSKYDKETEAALDGSIAKWEAIVAGNSGDKGTSNCPLCIKFADDECSDGHECAGCPVRKRVNDYGCVGTPYMSWLDYQRDSGKKFMPYKVFDDKSLRLAQAELDFLRSLKS